MTFFPPVEEERLGVTLPAPGCGAHLCRDGCPGAPIAGAGGLVMPRFLGCRSAPILTAPPWEGRAVGFRRRLLPPEPAGDINRH